jgi:hypothetical protein
LKQKTDLFSQVEQLRTEKARLWYNNLQKKLKGDSTTDKVKGNGKFKESRMFRRKSLSFSKKRSSASPPPSLADVDMGTPRERLNSDSQASLRRNSERKSFRR